MSEFLLRVKSLPDGGFTASIRQFAGAQHPEVRAVLGPVSHGQGRTEAAAMLSAICASRLGEPVAVREVARNGC